MSRNLFIGRFQPFHKGQMMVIQGMNKVCDEVIIGIGSPQAKENFENPFTLEERREMISSALLDEDIMDAVIVDCPDTDQDADWVDAVLNSAGDIDKVWTGNEDVAKLFQEKGIEVQTIKEVPGINGTGIREAMKNGTDWKDWVPGSVATVLKRINASERLKSL